MERRALVGCSTNLELVKPKFQGEGAKMVVKNIPFVAAGTSVNLGRALMQNLIDTKVIALVAEDLDSQLLINKIKHELGLVQVMDFQVLRDVPITIATESGWGTKYVCAKPDLIDDEGIIQANLAAIRAEIIGGQRSLRVATGVKSQEVQFANALLYGQRLVEEFLVLNPSLQLIQESKEDFLQLVSDVDLLVVNEVEAAAILGIEEEPGTEQFRDLVNVAKSVIVTLGKNGSCYFSHKEHYTVMPYPTQEDRSGGAGDCYLGFFLAGLIHGNDIESSMQSASCAASLKLEYPGASVQPSVERVHAAYQEHYGLST